MVVIIKNIVSVDDQVTVTTSSRHFLIKGDKVTLYGLRKNVWLNNQFEISGLTSTSFDFKPDFQSTPFSIIDEPFPLVANYYCEKWKTCPVIYKGINGQWQLQSIQNWRNVELGSVMSLGTFVQITVFIFEQAGNLLMMKMTNPSAATGKPNQAQANRTSLSETIFEPQIARAESVVLVEENFPSVHNIKSSTSSVQTFPDSIVLVEKNVPSACVVENIASSSSSSKISVQTFTDSFLNLESNLTDNLANPMANLVSKNPNSVVSAKMLNNLQTGLIGHVEADIIAQLSMKQSPQQLSQLFQKIENKVGSYQFWMTSQGHGKPIKWINHIYTAPTNDNSSIYKIQTETDLLLSMERKIGHVLVMGVNNKNNVKDLQQLYIKSVVSSTPIIGHSALLISFDKPHQIGKGDFLLVLNCRTFIITGLESDTSIRVSVERSDANATRDLVSSQKTPVIITSLRQRPTTYFSPSNPFKISSLKATDKNLLTFQGYHRLENHISPVLFIDAKQVVEATHCLRQKEKGNIVSRFVESWFEKPCSHDHWSIEDDKKILITKTGVHNNNITETSNVSIFPYHGYECMVQVVNNTDVVLMTPPVIEEFEIKRCYLKTYSKDTVTNSIVLPVDQEQGLILMDGYIETYNKTWLRIIQEQNKKKHSKEHLVISFHPNSDNMTINKVTYSSSWFGQNHVLTIETSLPHGITWTQWDAVTFNSSDTLYFDILKDNQVIKNRMQIEKVIDAKTVAFKVSDKNIDLETLKGAVLTNPVSFSCSAYRLWRKSLEMPILQS